MTDAVSVIKRDHQTVAQLFDEYQQAQDTAQKQALIQQIVQGLKQHAEMEEQILYPAMEQAFGAEQMRQNMQEHEGMRAAMQQLEALRPDDSAVDETVERLIADVMDHVRLKEEDELPRLPQQLGRDKLEDLGRQMEAFKGRSGT